MTRKLIVRSAAALALTVPALVGITAGPAQAAVTVQCPGPANHPDVFHNGTISFKNGAKIRTGPYNECTAVGEGQNPHGIDVHCGIANSKGVAWWYVRDTTTGKQGWVRGTDLNGFYEGAPHC